MQRILTLIFILTLLEISLAALPDDVNAQAPNVTYWVSTDGQAAWANCKGATPLNGAAACDLNTANQNAVAGDTVYLRGGTYSGDEILPKNSGISESSRIIFTGYNQENVLIRDSDNGIYIYKKSYITVNGINFYNLDNFMHIIAGHYNIISNCNFDTRSPESGDWAGSRIVDDFNVTAPAGEDSTYNWVHHCAFYRWAYGDYDEHGGGLLDIGYNNESEPGEDESYYNLIEDNVFAYGGHHTLGVYSKYNVIRNNYFHNENWDFEGYRATITEGPYAGYSLFEGNRFGFSTGPGIDLRSEHNIIRFNILYHHSIGAIQVVSSTDDVYHADYNHIYHNSFYHNGYLGDYSGFEGGMFFSTWGGRSPVGNVVKNNIFYDNKNGSVSYDGPVDSQVIENNWGQDKDDVNPGFVNLSDTGPNNPNLPDLHLQPNSPAIDKGTWLTTITSADGSGNSFTVADAEYFTDGWGIIEGDLIQLANGQRARITDIDYNTNVITVSTTLSWAYNMGLSVAFKGDAFDLGAYDFGPELELHARPADQAIRLDWTVNVTLPVTTTWKIDYYTTTTTAPFTVTGLISATRSYTLTEHAQNYQWYTVTLYAMLDETPWLSDTVRVMPTDRFVYLPLVLK